MRSGGREGVPGLETLPEPRFEFLFGMALEVEKPDPIGQTHAGSRRVTGVNGGVFEGPRLKGRVLPGGSDWITVRRGGVLIQDVRIVLQTEGGQNILMSYRGMRHGPEDVIEKVNGGEDPDPREYYFRTQPIFEAPEGKYDWLNKLLAFAVGRRPTLHKHYSSPFSIRAGLLDPLETNGFARQAIAVRSPCHLADHVPLEGSWP